MGRIYYKGQQFLDASGDPLAAGTINFYAEGTSNDQDTYSDEALSSANANPLVLDSEGRAGSAVYGSNTLKYKVVLKDSAGTTIVTEDNVAAYDLVSASLQTQVNRISEDPIRQGATGDGASDEATEVQAAIDAAETAGTRVVDLQGKTFRCDSQLTLHSGIILQNGTLDFTNCTDTEYITVSGARAAAVNASADVSAGDSQVSLNSVSGLSAEDWLFIKSDVAWGTNDHGEVKRIASISGSDALTHSAFDGAYATANTARAELLTPKVDIVLRDLKIIASNAASSHTAVAYFDICHNVTVERCRFDGYKAAAVEFRSCIGSRVMDCEFYDGNDSGGMGVRITEHSIDCHVRDCQAYGGATGIEIGASITASLGGINKHCSAKHNRIYGPVDGIVVQQYAQYIDVIGNEIHSTVSGSVGGVASYAPCVRISGNRVAQPFNEGILANHTVTATYDAAWFLDVSRNEILAPQTTGKEGIDSTVSGDLNNMRVCDNIIHDAPGRGIVCAFSGTANNLRFDRNDIYSPGIGGILISNSGTVERISACNNTSDGAASSYGITIPSNSGAVICSGNIIDGAGGIAIAAAGDRTIVGGNSIKCNDNTRGILIDASALGASVFGNTIHYDSDQTSNSTADAIQVDGTANISIVGNTIYNCRDGITVTCESALTGLVIASNTVWAAGWYGIVIAGSSSTLTGLCITGNVLHDCGVSAIWCNPGSTIIGVAVAGNYAHNDDASNEVILVDSGGSDTDLMFGANVILGGAEGIEVSASASRKAADGNIITSTGEFDGGVTDTDNV